MPFEAHAEPVEISEQMSPSRSHSPPQSCFSKWKGRFPWRVRLQ
jgi:hypothetical protein